MFGIGGFRLPGWARLRGRQMEEVAARVAVVAGAEPMQGLQNTGHGAPVPLPGPKAR